MTLQQILHRAIDMGEDASKLASGSTGSAFRAVRPPNLHITSDVRRDPLRRKRDRFLVTLALDHHGPGHPGDLVGKRDGGDFGGPPRQQRREPGLT
jgi:hypothetical protein